MEPDKGCCNGYSANELSQLNTPVFLGVKGDALLPGIVGLGILCIYNPNDKLQT